MPKFPCALLLCTLLGAAGCATSADVVPTGAGRATLEGSFGGPFTNLKATVVPAPGLVARGTYGVGPATDISASVLATPLLFSLLGLDVEAKEFVVRADGWVPAVGVSQGALALTSLRPHVTHAPLVLPLTGGTAAWAVAAGFAYLGTDVLWNTVPFAYLEATPRVTWSYFVGYRWELSAAVFVALELKKFVANWRTDEVAADLYSINATGLTEHHPQDGAWGSMVSAGWRL